MRKFLSTPPSRVATCSQKRWPSLIMCFYPRHPRGWRPGQCRRSGGGRCVSIHATLAGGDAGTTLPEKAPTRFLSTPPSRVATLCSRSGSSLNFSFYPRHPRGWRLEQAVHNQADGVSIHATLAGGDFSADRPRYANKRFYPRHPRGWRLCCSSCPRQNETCFYPRHPRGWRRLFRAEAMGNLRFYPRHPRGWRLQPLYIAQAVKSFYPRHPRGWRHTKSDLTAGPSCFYPRHPRGWRRRERIRQGKPR